MSNPPQHIPIIDFKEYNINVDKATVSEDVLKALSKELIEKFEKVGFCYIVNHGICGELVQRFMSICREFFELPTSEKKLYENMSEHACHGWIGMEVEALDNDLQGDLKETFNFIPGETPAVWPQRIQGFKEANFEMFDACRELGNNLLELMAMGLGVDRHFFLDTLKLIPTKENSTTLRSLYYPPLLGIPEPKPGQVRLGEHSDYGTMTILFQDNVGGLEVNVPDKGFVPATPIPGAVLVNIADMMQRWTSDRLIATRHRVRLPETEAERGIPRQSVAFFINPDHDVIVKCLDGSNKYEPIKGTDYVNMRILQSYS